MQGEEIIVVSRRAKADTGVTRAEKALLYFIVRGIVRGLCEGPTPQQEQSPVPGDPQ